MNRAVTYWETGSEDPRYNLAFEEYLLNSRTEGDHLLLWQNERAVVVGRNQNAEGEIDRAFVEAHGISVVRRITGGGAVYHDLGNLNYSFLTDAADGERQTMERFVLPVVSALRKLGLEAESSGRNDILVSGKRSPGRRSGSATTVSCTMGLCCSIQIWTWRRGRCGRTRRNFAPKG